MGPLSSTNPLRRKIRLSPVPFLFVLLATAAVPLRHLQAQGTVVTVPSTAVPLALPSAIAFDANGNLYLAETSHHLIRKVDPTGILSTVAGTGNQGWSGDGAAATSADLDSPSGLAVDGVGNLFLADTHNHRIREVSASSGIITTVAGTGLPGFSGDGGPAVAAQLSNPGALALNPSGDLYIADTGNHRIRRLDHATGLLTTVAGNGLQTFAGDNGPAVAASIDSPSGLAVDASGRLYIADTHNGRIRVVDPGTGIIRTLAGSGNTGASGDLGSATLATLSGPRGLSSDPAGNLYITDSQNHRIRRIDAITGLITTVAGNGVQQFAGDGGPAIAASLDTPRATALSPDGRLTVADTGNGRVRQLAGPVASATPIQTLAGLGNTTPGLFTISAPGVVAYGTGTLTAALLNGTAATGSVSLLETTSGGVSLVGTASLSANVAALSLAALPAGPHRLTATYTGDSTHTSAQSTSLLLTVSPAGLSVVPSAATMLFGQTPPTPSGTVSGLLPQDAASLSVTFSTTATSVSPTGVYPITAALTGAAAGNYAVALTPASLVITRAPAVVTLASSADSTSGAVTLSARVVSTTSGVPSGTVTFLDAQLPFAASTIGSSGTSIWTGSSLAAGSHSLTAFYSGDTNFTSSTSAASVLSLTGSGSAAPAPAADFTLSATGVTSQTISGTGSASFSFAIATQGAPLSSPITLAASGLPHLATASFTPSYIPPGSTSPIFLATITMPNAASLATPTLTRPPALTWITSLALLLPLLGAHRRSHARRCRVTMLATGILLFLPLVLLAGCGDRINVPASNPGFHSYTISISGTATTATGATVQHAATVTLNVQQ